MKNKYVTALMMLFVTISTQLNSDAIHQLYHRKTLTIKNSTTKTLKVELQSKCKNAANKTRHTNKTLILGPATTVCKKDSPGTAGYPTVYGPTSTGDFTYTINKGHDGNVQWIKIYDNANPTVALQTNIPTDLLNSDKLVLFEYLNKIVSIHGDTAELCY